jgi:hypothetical protein
MKRLTRGEGEMKIVELSAHISPTFLLVISALALSPT